MSVEDGSAEALEVGALRRQRRLLLRLRGRLAEDLTDIDRQLAELDRVLGRLDAGLATSEATEQDSDPLADQPAERRRRPLRAMVLDALEDLNWPATSRDLVGYLHVRFARQVGSARFGTLGSDEAAAFERAGGARPVWLCFGLDIKTGKPIKHVWARSDWPVPVRLIAPSSLRLQHLKMTLRLCELAQRPTAGTAHPERLAQLAATYARDLPGAVVPAGVVNTGHVATWRDIAADQLAQLEPRDAEIREQGAWSLRSASERQLLFGPIPSAGALELDDSELSLSGVVLDVALPRRRQFATLLPQLVDELAGDGAVHLRDLYDTIERRFPGLTDGELDGDGKLQWQHDLRWELETLVSGNIVRRRRDLGRGLYSPSR